MPELPEVETIKRDLSRRITGATIARVDVRLAKIVSPHTGFSRRVQKAHIVSVSRRAKLLMLTLERRHEQHVLLIHLKMTGQLVLQHGEEIIFGGHPIIGATVLPNKYSHVIFHFTNGDVLYFNDLRQFGYMKLVSTDEAKKITDQYGIEPLSAAFTFEAFDRIIKTHRPTRLKPLLLDQRHIAGLGNIYVDEACFRAKVRPSRRAGSLSLKERRALWRAIKEIIALSVKHRGTSFNTYVDADGHAGRFWKYLKVYRRTKEACKVCGTTIVRTTLVGRGTHYCPKCQH